LFLQSHCISSVRGGQMKELELRLEHDSREGGVSVKQEARTE